MSLGVLKLVSSRSLIACVLYIRSNKIVVVNFCLFFVTLLCAMGTHEKYFPMMHPLSSGKLGKLTTPHLPGKSDPFHGGGVNSFWNHTVVIYSTALAIVLS